MKLLTVSIAAYNVERYLEQCLDSLNDERYRDDIEVLIIDDGSTDRTRDIAMKYSVSYPQTFVYVSKENGGHGSTINKGIELAVGKYFRVIDGDDWVDREEFNSYVQNLKNTNSDVVLTQHVEVYKDKEIVISLIKRMNVKTTYNVNDAQGIERITLHMLTVKTNILKNNNVFITENCFYVDVEYVFNSLMYSKTVMYLDFPVYMYRLGESGQSVNKNNMKKNIHMQEIVAMNLMHMYEDFDFDNDGLKKILYRIISKSVGSVYRTYLLFAPFENSINMIKKFDDVVSSKYNKYYNQFRKQTFYRTLSLKNFVFAKLISFMYIKYCKYRFGYQE